ncbi:indolepyruvate ferredoxin oxidoreductase beta subunit [Peptoniphilus olsenii]|uniref:Indolepyruvate ferredoxin oxidoreductase beta subunit n=1 Tax=Peptoniphilus olsenii TaxID=411570 RepID=A0ABV2J9U8_9FIRM
MDTKNILLAGVGGQGLVLATQIIADAANFDGIDVKTNDVVGLSQRGGKVWGSAKLGKKVYSPNINPGEGDLLIAFEKLEAKRFRHILKKQDSKVIINDYEMAPSKVQQEAEEYDENVIEKMQEFANEVIVVNATDGAAKLGNPQVANIIMLGVAARFITNISHDAWISAIEKNVPEKFIDLNIEAFDKALNDEL